MTMKFSNTILLLVFLLFLHSRGTQCTTRNSKMFEFQTQKQRTRPSAEAPKREGKVFYPIGYGADPTGQKDSSAAILAAIEDAVKMKEGLFLMPGISDLGGPVIDLQGQSFSISSPIRFPPNIGNLVMKGGSIRAFENFPANRHLIELWAPDSKFNSKLRADNPNSDPAGYDPNKGMKYEDIIFKDLLLDSSYRGGGIALIDAARVRIASCYFLHFTTHGVIVERGHETFITDTFLGQRPTVGGDKEEKHYTGTAIDIASTDNSISNVAVFSGETGIVLRGRANIVTNVHCYNKATYFGGVGILVKSAQNRITDAYLDYNSIVIEDPDQISITDGFFLGDGNIVLKAIEGKISGLNIMNNVFSGNPKNMVPTVSLEGNFKSVDQVAVEKNLVSGMSLKSTVANLNVHGNATKWVADFSRMLLFPNHVSHLQYTLYIRGGGNGKFPALAVTRVSNNVVEIETEYAVNGVVSVSVDQHNMPAENAL